MVKKTLVHGGTPFYYLLFI